MRVLFNGPHQCGNAALVAPTLPPCKAIPPCSVSGHLLQAEWNECCSEAMKTQLGRVSVWGAPQHTAGRQKRGRELQEKHKQKGGGKDRVMEGDEARVVGERQSWRGYKRTRREKEKGIQVAKQEEARE